MSDNPTLQRILRRNVGDAVADGLANDRAYEADTVAGCFGFLRGARERAMCLELRKKTGQIMAINYSYISRFEYEPTTGIQLHVGAETVKIAGTNLNAPVGPQVRLFEAISRHKVPWVSESDRVDRLSAEADSVIISAIQW